MGMFDYVQCSGPEFVCSEGHRLDDEEFQTKDLGNGLDRWNIDGVLDGPDGGSGYGYPVDRPFSGKLNVYCSCSKCPAFVCYDTYNLWSCWVELEVIIKADKVTSVTRVSDSTDVWLNSSDVKYCWGPMPHAEARRMHVSHVFYRDNSEL